ncbi:MAG: hypothetical protein IT210_18165 [Armatimonadetes bacterium]|nr:hypothetical protein [Armatimonadota bacterium]
MTLTPKARMLNAYRGIVSDRLPVAPEFWYYYPAKVLGVDMIQFEREIPLWQALQATFRKYGTEGWGVTFPGARSSLKIEGRSSFTKVSETRYVSRSESVIAGKTYASAQMYDQDEPSWVMEYPVKSEAEAGPYLDASLGGDLDYDFTPALNAYRAVGEDYLLEMWLGAPFTDFIAGAMGFEESVLLFHTWEEAAIESLQRRFIERQLEMIRRACEATPFESFCIGCSSACNSLIGPRLWRRWDKPFIEAAAREIHRNNGLLHIHFHGKCRDTLADFAELNLDCVCPFERPPGGDINGPEGLREVRSILGGKVTVNGNVHTVETLIRGTPEKVRQEVRQIKEAFAGEPRLIIGTGDQVGRETPEDNIYAMIEEAKRGENVPV